MIPVTAAPLINSRQFNEQRIESSSQSVRACFFKGSGCFVHQCKCQMRHQVAGNPFLYSTFSSQHCRRTYSNFARFVVGWIVLFLRSKNYPKRTRSKYTVYNPKYYKTNFGSGSPPLLVKPPAFSLLNLQIYITNELKL